MFIITTYDNYHYINIDVIFLRVKRIIKLCFY